jgi:hypothetical protein
MNTNAYVKREYGSLVGKKIETVRPMTPAEMRMFYWNNGAGGVGMVIELDDGTALVPSCDPEGNGPGHIFVEKTVAVPAR